MQLKDAVSLALFMKSSSTEAPSPVHTMHGVQDCSPSSNEVVEGSVETNEVNQCHVMTDFDDELNEANEAHEMSEVDDLRDVELKDLEACSRKVQPRKRLARRIICCTVCSLTSLALIGSSVGLLYPRYPQWEITECTFTDAAKMGLVRVFTDPSFNTSETFDGIKATVNFFNSNFVTSDAGRGDFAIWFNNTLNVGTANVQPVKIPARSNVTIYSTASMTITPDAAKALLADVLANNFAIRISVIGAIPATVFGFVKVQMHAECDIEADALQLLQDTNKLVKSHSCTYSVGL